jgi:hypothetical protein
VEVASERVYFIDADSLLLLERRLGTPDASPAVWEPLAALVRAGRLRTPEQVFKEVSRQSSTLAEWLAKHPEISVPTSDLWDRAKEITGRYPDLAGAEPGAKGDPWLIAAAERSRPTGQTSLFDRPAEPWVITQEQPRPRAQRVTRIAEVCRELDIECADLSRMLHLEGLQIALVPTPE